MLGNLHQRIGDADAPTPAVESAIGQRQAWGRILSVDHDIRQGGTVSPHSNGRQSGFQAGTDLWASGAWRAGLYVGQLDGDMQVDGFARGTQGLAVGSNDLRSRYLGGYATWARDGWYVDTVLQGGRHRYTVRPQGGASAKGKADSFMASVEVGKSFGVGDGWVVEPQLQLVHQRINLDAVDIGGARVTQDSDRGWTARAGVRVKGDIATGAGRLQPYGRFNVYRRNGGGDTTQFSTLAAVTPIATRTGGTTTEAAAGFTLALNERTSVYGEVGKQWASGGGSRVGSSVQGSVGLRVRW
jgi:outer membrane autotransporter protein